MLNTLTQYASNSLRMARVIDSHPYAHAVDIQYLDDNSRLNGVQVISTAAASDSGFSQLPSPTKKDTPDRPHREILCVVASVNSTPVVMGFLFPQVSSMAFDKESGYEDMGHWRMPGQSYIAGVKDGSMAVVSPQSGGYIHYQVRAPAGERSGPAMLGKGSDYDNKWCPHEPYGGTIEMGLAIVHTVEGYEGSSEVGCQAGQVGVKLTMDDDVMGSAKFWMRGKFIVEAVDESGEWSLYAKKHGTLNSKDILITAAEAGGAGGNLGMFANKSATLESLTVTINAEHLYIKGLEAEWVFCPICGMTVLAAA